jgi:hypothetical protein
MRVRFPSIADVAQNLRDINANVEGECDVRLCVWTDGTWCVRWGDVQFDPSSAPYCGASGVPGVVGGKVQRFDARAIARDLLDQCAEMRAQDE